MPKDYEKIKESFAEHHKGMPMKDVKMHAAMIAQAQRRKQGKPSIKWSKYTSKEK